MPSHRLTRPESLWMTGAIIGVAGWLLAACAGGPGSSAPPRIIQIEAAPRTAGDPDRGLHYLLHGDYIGGGIPIELWRALTAGQDPGEPEIVREGVDRTVPITMNQYLTPHGAEVVAGVNCLACHASEFRGEFIIGMGNSFGDWTSPPSVPRSAMRFAAAGFAPGSPQARAFEQFARGTEAVSNGTATPFRGVNPAFRIEELAAAHRNPADLSWTTTRVFEPMETFVASDVPAWWLLKKKHALYYNGMGRGDPATMLQQIGVVMIEDKADAERILPNMADLVAYIETLEAPKYPGPIDADLARRGEAIFAANCMDCHGSYGPGGKYPNKLVPVEIVGTDSLYAEQMRASGLHGWYNQSWYATGGKGSYASPELAYIAPPLDGVWATAPYFHNGSVPTLEAVLDSSKRPAMWWRSFDPMDYDLDALGWRHRAVDAADGRNVYDTTIPGYGAHGHTFGDALSDEERAALLEYLKGL